MHSPVADYYSGGSIHQYHISPRPLDVYNMQAIQEVAEVSKKRIVPLSADLEQIRQTIDRNYKLYGDVEKKPGKAAPQETELAKGIKTFQNV